MLKNLNRHLYLKAGGLELNPHSEAYFAAGEVRDNENHILFLCELVSLLDLHGASEFNFKVFFDEAKRLLQVDGYPGLYHRGHGKLKYHEAYNTLVDQSHDNQCAFACLNYFYYGECDEIMSHLRKNKYRIDNIYPEKPRFSRTLHPRDIIFLNYLRKTWWSYLFLPLLSLMAFYSCWKIKEVRPTWYQIIWDKLFKIGLPNKHEEIATSGKCLYFIRLYATRERTWSKLTWKICEWIMIKRTGMTFIDAVRLYFVQRAHPNHPIIQLCDLIKSKDVSKYNAA